MANRAARCMNEMDTWKLQKQETSVNPTTLRTGETQETTRVTRVDLKAGGVNWRWNAKQTHKQAEGGCRP